MCIFQEFYFKCGCNKLKISRPCGNSAINVQGQMFCRDDPHPHIDDANANRQHDPVAFGPGVCNNIYCKWRWGLLPIGMYEEEVRARYGHEVRHQENDASFDMSEDAGKEREDRWFRMLTTDQQFECIGMTFPVPDESKSLYAQAYFSQDAGRGHDILTHRYYELSSSQLQWYDLNPRYMNDGQLRHATGLFLPATVTIPGNPGAHYSTPRLPQFGPFKVVADHRCSSFPGICRGCGRYIGDPQRAEQHRTSEREDMLTGPMRPIS